MQIYVITGNFVYFVLRFVKECSYNQVTVFTAFNCIGVSGRPVLDELPELQAEISAKVAEGEKALNESWKMVKVFEGKICLT